MSDRTENTLSECLNLTGYVEARFANGGRRTYRYPENGIPEVSVAAEEMESSIVVALRDTQPA